MGGEACQIVAFEGDAASLRAVEAVEAVEQGGLPRAVGPDDGQNLPAADIEADIEQRLGAAEAQRDVLHPRLDVVVHASPHVFKMSESSYAAFPRRRGVNAPTAPPPSGAEASGEQSPGG